MRCIKFLFTTVVYTFLLLLDIILSRTTPKEHAWKMLSANGESKKKNRKKLFFLLSRAFFVMLMKSFLLVICRFELSLFLEHSFQKQKEKWKKKLRITIKMIISDFIITFNSHSFLNVEQI